MIAIVDYGVGNLFSLKSSLSYIGADACVTGDGEKIKCADKIILPGVGAFGDAVKKLRDARLDEVIVSQAKKGKPIMGICLGMQLLFDKSFEYGEHSGLGLIKGEIRPISDVTDKNLKIPHIGWNSLKFTDKKSRIFRYIKDGNFVYFVHSYYAANCDESVIANAEYGANLTAAVQCGNVYGCQFHPEKSGALGLKLLENFAAMTQGKGGV